MNKKSIIIIFIELIILLVLIIIANSNLINYMPKCWIYQNTGIFCPACGGTRCVLNMLQGNFKQAFFSNMIFFIMIVYLLTCNIIYIINLNRKNKIATWIYPKYWYAIIFVIILLIYTIIRNIVLQ